MVENSQNVTDGRVRRTTGLRRLRIILWGAAMLLAALFIIGLVSAAMDARDRKAAEAEHAVVPRKQVDPSASLTPHPAPVSALPHSPIRTAADQVALLVARYKDLLAKATMGGGLKALDTSSLGQLETDLVEVDSKLSDLEDRLASPRQMVGLPATFSVSGEVKDVTAAGLVVWGRALPQKPGALPSANGMSGAVMEEGNLLVENPERAVDVGGIYVGENIFLGRGTGRNRLGAEVPVWRYGIAKAPSSEQNTLLSLALSAHDAARQCRIENSSIIPEVHDEQELRKKAAPRAP